MSTDSVNLDVNFSLVWVDAFHCISTAEVIQTSDAFWGRIFAALANVASDIRGECGSASMADHLHLVMEIVRYVGHVAERDGKAAQLEKGLALIVKEFKTALTRAEARITRDNNTTPVNVRDLESDFKVPRCVKAIPWVLVLAEDADLCGPPCKVPLVQIQQEVEEKLGSVPAVLLKSTRVLPPLQACDCNAIRAVRMQNQQEQDNVKSVFPYKKRQATVAVRHSSAVQYLLSECSDIHASCETAERLWFLAFAAEKMGAILREQPEKVSFALRHRHYDEVGSILQRMHHVGSIRSSILERIPERHDLRFILELNVDEQVKERL